MIQKPTIAEICGLKVSTTWFGDYSALYLELGKLTPKWRKDGSAGHPLGEITLYAGFGWRVEGPRSIRGGSKSSRTQWVLLAKKLEGATIQQAEATGRIPELAVGFSNGLWLVTFDSYGGQPEWSISFNRSKQGHLGVENGHLVHDDR